jgi:flagellar biosynthetic protein FliQ
MTSGAWTHALREAIWLVLLLAAPSVLAVLATGVATSLLQTVTQVREPTVSTVPKLLVALLVLALAGPWMGGQLVGFMHTVLDALPAVGRP